jgi:Right handed beta helix region
LKNQGDFSRWLRYLKGDNFNGVLYQQGRVLCDVDGTTQTRLVNEWQQVAGSDIIGSGVAAIPSGEQTSNSFKIDSVKLDVVGQNILLQVMPGRAWVNGLLVNLENGVPSITRSATYLGPPFNKTPPTISAGARDAIILEVHQEAISAFQLPKQLLEHALGGPDTSEILHTSIAFKLLRLSNGDNCSNLGKKLEDDFNKKAKLTVTLDNPTPVTGECPVDENFGYTGITHNAIRIEVADVNPTEVAKFKWSKFNGGMVGRGNYTDSTKSAIKITHNLQAIIWSDITNAYLEILIPDPVAGHWKVVYGTAATLNTTDKEITFSGAAIFGNHSDLPDDTDGIFFRLWNGIDNISKFTSDTFFMDGILLRFDPPTTSNYHPQDYWMFEVRAGGIEMPKTLIDNSPPQGVYYHRVPLSIIEWKSDNTASILEDCRVIFPPLIEQKEGGCCTLRVGDGKSSHGDYDSLQEAINFIKKIGGGEICLLDGEHVANAIVEDTSNIVIRGCGNKVKLLNKETTSPIISIIDSDNILLEGIAFEARNTGAIRLEEKIKGKLSDIEIKNNSIRSFGNAIEVIGGLRLTILGNHIVMGNKREIGIGIYLNGKDITIEKNRITARESRSLGGIHVGNGSENIKVLNNIIEYGSGNGITLGDRFSEGKNPFIYDVLIDNNSISNMGLTGIGLPRLFLPDEPDTDNLMEGRLTLRTLATLISGLQICRNRIVNCLQKRFDQSMRDEVKLPYRAFGGIALGSCEKVCIIENRIENNGMRHTDPVCGIFIYYATEIEITQNYISQNGPFVQGGDLQMGNRGGIVLVMVFDNNTSKVSATSYRGEDYGVRIHNNIVKQPAGLALKILAIGFVTVLNNFFKSDLLDPFAASQGAAATSRLRVGCIMILNLGRYKRGTLFNDNQIQCSSTNQCSICQMIGSINDLCFGSNEVGCFNRELTSDTFLVGGSIRAYENRLEEVICTSNISLLSFSNRMNSTTHNQCNYCTTVINLDPTPSRLDKTGNQVLNSARCSIISDKLTVATKGVSKAYE